MHIVKERQLHAEQARKRTHVVSRQVHGEINIPFARTGMASAQHRHVRKSTEGGRHSHDYHHSRAWRKKSY